MVSVLKTWMGRLLALTFLCLSVSLVGLAGFQFFTGLAEEKELINILIKSVNTCIIALAIFELGIGIGKEYNTQAEESDHTYTVVRRTIARFVSTVCIALVLEGLIMIIKYSQLELAGNLYYPVGILVGSSILLASMGLFLQLTRGDCEVKVKKPVNGVFGQGPGMPQGPILSRRSERRRA